MYIVQHNTEIMYCRRQNIIVEMIYISFFFLIFLVSKTKVFKYS